MGSLTFLNTKITRKVDGKLDITVYRKQMHMDRYLHFILSYHPTLEDWYSKVSVQLSQLHYAAGTESGGRGRPPHESFLGE